MTEELREWLAAVTKRLAEEAAREFATVLTRGEQVDALEDLAAELQVRADDLRTAMREATPAPPAVDAKAAS